MFERYTDKARRVIFFARYEACQYGSPEIDTEHLLLGLLRENKTLFHSLPNTTFHTIGQRVDECSPKRPMVPANVDLPLSDASKKMLKHAADESELLGHKHIGTEHLLLGLFDEENCFAAQLLREVGADPASIRLELADSARKVDSSFQFRSIPGREHPSIFSGPIAIHGILRNSQYIREAVQRCRMYNWHWRKRNFTKTDIVIEKKIGKVSFDLTLAADSANFDLVQSGWTKDHCVICRWELFESKHEADVAHTAGYTNGRDWLCAECYEKFWARPDFISSSFSDIT